MKKILVIEDDPDIQYILSLVLEENGYQVHCSLTGNEIDDLSGILPDLILLDLRLTGALKSGTEICIYLKQHPVMSYLPIILVSAEHNIKEIALKCGADDFIKKPFDIDHLTNKVKAVLAES